MKMVEKGHFIRYYEKGKILVREKYGKKQDPTEIGTRIVSVKAEHSRPYAILPPFFMKIARVVKVDSLNTFEPYLCIQ